MSLLKKDTIKKKQVNKLLKFKLELDIEKDKKYKIEVISDGTMDTSKIAR